MSYYGRSCETGELVTVQVREDRIVGVDAGRLGEPLGGPDVWLSAGFIDLQVNGYAGHDFNPGAWLDAGEAHADIAPIYQRLAAAGAALICPTIATAGHAALTSGFRRLAAALDQDRRLRRATAGLHLEGPYISGEDGPRGAHAREHARDPDWDEFQRLQEAAGGLIKIVTLAPERPGAIPFIEKAVAAGMVVAIGHTGADGAALRDAVRAGARMSTHLGNGAHALLPRHPNYIWEQLACDDLFASIIADGQHLPSSVVRCIARVKGPERLALVSDVVSLAGLPPGRYNGGRYEVLPSGTIIAAGTPYLAGASALLDVCVANLARCSHLTIAQAAGCASAVPARILGCDDRKGALRAGWDADLTLFRFPDEGPLEIVATVVGGEVVHRGG